MIASIERIERLFDEMDAQLAAAIAIVEKRRDTAN
jgi:hypothetical protein